MYGITHSSTEVVASNDLDSPRMILNFETIEATAAVTLVQLSALFKVAERQQCSSPCAVFGGYGGTMFIKTPTGMVVGVEPDGYAHT